MARQKGLMKYIGTIGDVRHFKIKGQPGFYAGLVGGPTAQQVKTAPEFERTRENMNEFGDCFCIFVIDVVFGWRQSFWIFLTHGLKIHRFAINHKK